jgi:putative redox protein
MAFTKDVTLRHIQGVTFIGKGNSNHWVMMDGKPDFGGSEAGSSPKELLLIALAGCTSNDVLPILKKKRVEVSDFTVNIHAEEREEHPRIFTSVHVEYVFYGDSIKEQDVERAIELSTTKYCSVSAIIAASVKITHSYKIEPAANKP